MRDEKGMHRGRKVETCSIEKCPSYSRVSFALPNLNIKYLTRASSTPLASRSDCLAMASNQSQERRVEKKE